MIDEDTVLSYEDVPVAIAARYLEKSQQDIRKGLEFKRYPFGIAERPSGKRFTYHINPKALIVYRTRMIRAENRKKRLAL